MRIPRATCSYEPARARPAKPTKRRYGGLVVITIYASVLGLNEWRMHRHVDAIRARANAPAIVEEVPAALPGPIDGLD